MHLRVSPIRSWFTVALLLPAFAVAGDASADADQVRSDVRALSNAVFAADIDTVLRYTHPSILEAMGGEDAARAALGPALESFRSGGMTLESLEFPEEPTFVAGKDNDYALVPTRSIFSSDGRKILSTNFQFGIRPKGGDAWTYVEGSRVSPELLTALFPDFPKDTAMPPVAREPLAP